MAKTINSEIDIFATESSARTAWRKTKSGHLLFAPDNPWKAWFIDRSKTAKKEWPTKYRLMEVK